MKALAKTSQKESSLAQYLYWALEKRKKIKVNLKKNVFGELPQKTWLREFWSKNHTKTALLHPKIIENFKSQWNMKYCSRDNVLYIICFYFQKF